MVFNVLAGLAAALFFVAAFRSTGLWGWGVGGYFESAIMLLIIGFATKSCGCYCHHGCGCEMTEDEEGSMTCDHPADCSCGDCDRCTK